MRINIAVGVVINGTPGRAHQKRSRHKDQNDTPVGSAIRRQPQRPERWPQQQQRPNGLVQTHQPGVSQQSRGEAHNLPARASVLPGAGPENPHKPESGFIFESALPHAYIDTTSSFSVARSESRSTLNQTRTGMNRRMLSHAQIILPPAKPARQMQLDQIWPRSNQYGSNVTRCFK